MEWCGCATASVCPPVSPSNQRDNMASIDQIQALLTKENAKLKDGLGAEIMKQVGVLLDNRLEAHEAKIMTEIRALQKRTEALETKCASDEASVAGTANAKRARSEPWPAPVKHELKPVVVLTGFPFNSRKQELESFVKSKLKDMEQWSHLTPFAPGVRASSVLVKVRSRDEVFEFIQHWKDTGFEYKGKAIRARADKTPEQRKANSKIYKMAEHLKTAFIDRDVDADFKRSSVWLGEWEVVRWDTSGENFQWIDDQIVKSGATIDREAAMDHVNKA